MLQLVPETDPLLTKPCLPFDFAKPAFDPRQMVADMSALMLLKRGVGLAAPQVGIDARLFVMGDDGFAIACFNPEIVERSPHLIRADEGCLSFPDLWLKIERPQWLVGRFQDVNGHIVEQRFFNLLARCYAHERDHLDGICFTDRVGPLALQIARTRRKKLQRERKHISDEPNQR